MQFVPDQYLYAVLRRESGNYAALMFPNTACKIIGHADVQGTIPPACQDVYKETHEIVPGFPLARE
jgi:hypothetical protein